MKQVYGYPTQQVNQYANHVQDLRKQHYNLVVSIRDELQVEVPEPSCWRFFKEPAAGDQQQVVVVEMMPQQMQPGFRRRGPGTLATRTGRHEPWSSDAQPDDAADGAAEDGRCKTGCGTWGRRGLP